MKVPYYIKCEYCGKNPCKCGAEEFGVREINSWNPRYFSSWEVDEISLSSDYITDGFLGRWASS